MTTRVALVITLTFFGTGAGAIHGQQPMFSSRVDAVRVDVLVTDGHGPVRGLAPADFEVRDNGVLQQVDLVSFDQIPLNVVLTLDMSASVAGDRLDRLRSAGAAILRGLKPGDRGALVTFSHVVRLAAGLSTDIASVRTALTRASGDGATSLTDGVYTGIVAGQADAGRELLIVFSDGLDTSSWLPADRVLDVAKRSDVVVYALAVRSPAKPEFLHDLTSFTGGRLFEVEKTGDLDAIFTGILEEFRQRYLVSYTPRGVAREGWHKLDVRVKRGGTVKARPGYQS
jgi:VWFA-related protein